MNVLFTSYPLHGHVLPMLPLALAARRAGHRVAFATGADMTEAARRRGLEAWAVGPTHAEASANERPGSRWFTDTAGPRASDLVPRAQAWPADLVVADEFELAGPVAARTCGVPLVVHGLGPMVPEPIWRSVEPAMQALHAAWGLDDGPGAVREALYLETMPPALAPRTGRMWPRARPLRPVAGIREPGEALPASLRRLPHEATVHLTLGTLFHRRVDVLRTALEGLRELGANVVVTVGPDGDPAALGPQPAHVVVERHVPHELLLPRCRLVVSQGGAGVLLGALAHGLPQLVLPQGADQFLNAAACERAGAGLVLEAEAVSAPAVREAATRLLAEPAFARAAGVVAAQIAAMPDADALVREIAGERCAGAAA